MIRAVVSLTVVLSVSLAQAAESAAQAELAEVWVLNVMELQAPVEGDVSAASIRESDRVVARVLRLAPKAVIREHYHPYFDEVLLVYSGAVAVMLNDQEHELRSGDVVYIPAGTIISGLNAGPEEAVLGVVWANLGERGPLFVYGRPGQPDGAANH